MIVNVKVTFTIPVEVPDEPKFNVKFYIEENGCAGTGAVGSALREHMERHEESSTCWACALHAQSKIVNE
jgi:hypothetical protein